MTRRWSRPGPQPLARDQRTADRQDRHQRRGAAWRPWRRSGRARYPQALATPGVVRRRQQRFAEAERHPRTALQIDPAYARAYTNLGALLLQKQRWSDGAAMLRQAVALDPASAEAHNNLTSAVPARAARSRTGAAASAHALPVS